ncbi:Vacuolar fusion protein mon1 [Sorochytrium milnesiophthora]
MAQASRTSAKHAAKHFFLLSDAGKPVFAYAAAAATPHSQNSDESGDAAFDGMSPTFASLVQATVANFTAQGESLVSFASHTHRFVLLSRPPLLLLACSRGTESEMQLRQQLVHLHSYIFFLLTHAQIQALFARSPNLDLRRLLQSSATSQLTHLCCLMDSEYRYFANCLETIAMDQRLRSKLGRAMVQGVQDVVDAAAPSSSSGLSLPGSNSSSSKNLSRSEDPHAALLYAMLVAQDKLVTLIRPRRHSLHPSDLHHLFTLLSSPSSQQFHETDSWVPLCLPKFNDRGFLHAYISFSIAPGVGLILVSCDRDSLPLMCRLKEHMVGNMLKQGLVLALTKALSRPPYAPGEAVTLSPWQSLTSSADVVHQDLRCVRHFLYKARQHVQFTQSSRPEVDVPRSPALSPSSPDMPPSNKSRVLESYEILQAALHDPLAPLKLIWRETTNTKTLAWVSSSFELYMIFDQHTNKVDGVRSANRIVKWVKQNEGTLFILDAPSF